MYIIDINIYYFNYILNSNKCIIKELKFSEIVIKLNQVLIILDMLRNIKNKIYIKNIDESNMILNGF